MCSALPISMPSACFEVKALVSVPILSERGSSTFLQLGKQWLGRRAKERLNTNYRRDRLWRLSASNSRLCRVPVRAI